MVPESLSLAAAFVTGIAGSAHCFGMCGGMAGAIGLRARLQSASAAGAFAHTGLYHVGRLSGYAVAGALVGATSGGLKQVIDLGAAQATLRIASGLLLILIAVRLVSRWNPLGLLERGGARFWSLLAPLRRLSGGRGSGSALMLGLLWGWLPCGLVYSMLAFAALSGSASGGAAILVAFGLGTLPALMTGSLLASQLQRLVQQRWPRMMTATLLAAFGLWTLAMPLAHTGWLSSSHVGH